VTKVPKGLQETRKMAQETKMGHGHKWEPRETVQKRKNKGAGSQGDGSRRCRGSGSSKRQEPWNTIVAQVEVKKMAEDGCCSAQGRNQGTEWETRSGLDTRRTTDGR